MNEQQTVSSNGTLDFKQIFRADAGTYTCTASNKMGDQSYTDVLVRVIGELQV